MIGHSVRIFFSVTAIAHISLSTQRLLALHSSNRPSGLWLGSSNMKIV